MIRKLYQRLLDWKNSDFREPLILKGAHLTGKTFLIKYFGQNEYLNYVYCDFEKDHELANFFDDLGPKFLIRKISLYKKKEIFPLKTLIIFDNIENCPSAITSLKYFKEEANEYHIIAISSFLDISLINMYCSFPVGCVRYMELYPLDFEEYLMAKNEQSLIDKIKDCYEHNIKLDDAFHQKALEYYKEYLFVGGMPNVVEKFNQNKNYELVKINQQEILDSYIKDMHKYNNHNRFNKIYNIYKNISSVLKKENKKFQYKDFIKGKHLVGYNNAIDWVTLLDFATRVYRLEKNIFPLSAYKSVSDFKFYLNDVGLFCLNENLSFEDLLKDNLDINLKNGLIENYVFNQLMINGLNLYYLMNQNNEEISFITTIDSEIIPIEVKSSNKELKNYIEKYQPKYAIYISDKNFSFENNIKYVPLYATFCIKKI